MSDITLFLFLFAAFILAMVLVGFVILWNHLARNASSSRKRRNL